MNIKDLKQGHTYIIRKGHSMVTKLKILELTETTAYILNVDVNTKYREELTMMGYTWKILEDLGDDNVCNHLNNKP